MKCPNKNSPQWKALVSKIGSFEAMREFLKYDGIPDASNYNNETAEAFQDDFLFDPTTVNETPVTGVFDKFIRYKENQLSILRSRLYSTRGEKKNNESNEAEYKRLVRLEGELEILINGSQELGVTGLVDEIAGLKKKADINAIGYYVEKDLDRLAKLVQSTNPLDIAEAKQIINFIKALGVFQNNVEHPIFNKEDLYFEDGSLRISPELENTYTAWANRTINYENVLNNREEEALVETVNNSTQVRNIYKDGLEFSEIVSKNGLKDTDWISMWTMDISNGIFSHNGLTPQVMLKTLQDAFEEKAKYSREVREKLDQLQPRVEKILGEQGFNLLSKGILGIKGVSYDLFKQTTSEGRETGRVVHRYTSDFFSRRDAMMNDFKTDIQIANLAIDPAMKQAMYAKAYAKKKTWYLNNVIVLNLNKLPEIVDNAEFQEYESEFDRAGAEAYKKAIVDIIGEQGYQEELQKQIKQIQKYKVAKANFIEMVLQENGVDSIENLSERDKSTIKFWELRNDPFNGIKDYYTRSGLAVGPTKVFSNMTYNLSIPRKNITGFTVEGDGYKFMSDPNRETGFYDKNFERIESNPTLKEFHNLTLEVLKNIKESLPPEMQDRLSVNSIPALKKSMLEIITSSDISFTDKLGAVVKELRDRIKRSYTIVKQGQISYAVTDVITGKPNYEVSTAWLNDNSREVSNIQTLEKAKFLQAYNANRKEHLGIIGNFTVVELDGLSDTALSYIFDYSGISSNNIADLRARYGNKVPIGKVIKDYATHTVVQQQSFDLPKIMRYYSDLAAEYSARTEVLPIMKVMKEHYDNIKKPRTNNAGENLTNEQGETQLDGFRKNAISQMDWWFEAKVLGNQNYKSQGVVNVLGRIKNKNAANKIKDIASGDRLKYKFYLTREQELIKELDAAIENETNPETVKELEDIKENMGRNFSASTFFDGLFNFTRFVRLGYNVSSSVTNFIEGTVSNMIIASSGEYFDPSLIYPAYAIVRNNTLLNSSSLGYVRTKEGKKNKILMERYRVLQDSSNELQKVSVKTNFGKIQKLAPYEIVKRTEFINQSPLMISILMDTRIKNKNGEEASVWDSMDENGKLTEDFRTEENIKNWEDNTGQNFKDFKSKLSKAIVKGHGNYDNMRGMMGKSNTMGKALLMFKTWMSMQFYQRFAVQQDDLASGIKDFKGRYWSLTPSSGAILGATAALPFLGPIGAAAGFLIGGAIANVYGANTGLGFLTELAYTTKQLFLKSLGMPVNLIAGREVVKTGDFSNFQGEKFNAQDARNMRSNIADISMIMSFIILALLSKAAFFDDEDDEPDTTHNLLVNRFMQLISQGTTYVNPSTTWKSTVGDIMFIKWLEDVVATVKKANDYLEGEDTIASGPHAGESALANQLTKTYLPGIFKDQSLGFKSQAERQFTPTEFDRWFWSQEHKDKIENKGDRAARKIELEEQGMTDKEIRKVLNQELPTVEKQKKRGTYKNEDDE